MSEESKETPQIQGTDSTKKSGSTMPFLVLGVLIVAAISALAFVSNTVIAEQKNGVQPASGEAQNDQAIAFDPAVGPEEDIEVGETVIKKGDPVVANIGGDEIKRSDVFLFIAQLPPQMRQQSIDVLFPMALEQTINAKLIEERAVASGVTEDNYVKMQLEQAEKNIIRQAYVQQIVEEGISDDDVKKRYEEYVKQIPEAEETKASHILVETEEKAKELIKELDGGADFAELAKNNSTGPSAPNGGDLGYFVKEQMVPEFAEVAFKLDKGSYTKEPVQTQFGWHVIKAEDRRARAKPQLEEVRQLIETEIKRDVLDQQLEEWRGALEIKTFDINGEPLKESSAEDTQEAEEDKG